MLKPVLRLVQFGGLAFFLGGCLFDGWGAGIPDVPSIKDDEPYVRALMDANGLKDVPLYDVLKVEDSAARELVYYISLSNRGLKEFRFTEGVAKLKAIKRISLIANDISEVPQGILFKKWEGLWLDNNKMCDLSHQDSTLLVASGASWENQDCKVQ